METKQKVKDLEKRVDFLENTLGRIALCLVFPETGTKKHPLIDVMDHYLGKTKTDIYNDLEKRFASPYNGLMADAIHKRLPNVLFTNDTDTFVAKDKDHLLKLLEETYGNPWEDDSLEDNWYMIPRDKEIGIMKDPASGDYTKETKTAAQWSVETKPGLLCSTEW